MKKSAAMRPFCGLGCLLSQSAYSLTQIFWPSVQIQKQQERQQVNGNDHDNNITLHVDDISLLLHPEERGFWKMDKSMLLDVLEVLWMRRRVR